MVSPALPRTILVVDVERFGDHSRTDSHRVAVHASLYNLLKRALRGAGIDWDSCHCEDRGDGVMVLVQPEVPKVRFSDNIPGRLAEALRRYNLGHPEQEQIRLRMALHAGEVIFDKDGVVSSAVNETFRLVDAAPLKEALRDSPGALAVIVSAWFYDSVIRNSPKFREEAYSPVWIDVKETRTVAWITMPDRLDLAGPRARDEPWRIRLQDSDGKVYGPGIMVCGRYAITSAQVAARALRLPSPSATTRPSGQVFFDVPARPAMEVRRAEIIWWRPALPDGGVPAGPGLAGLSIVGPAIRGISEPVLRFDLGPSWRTVRLRTCTGAGDDQDRLPVRALLRVHSANGQEPVPLDRLTDNAPDITNECHGSDVIDERTGEILGIAAVTVSGGSGDDWWMTPIGKIADDWPLLRRIAAQGEHHVSNHIRARTFSRADILRLAEKGLQIPALAEAQSRHLIASELPLEVMLKAPRSSVDRADLTALLWSCAYAPSALIELARKIRARSLGGRKENDLVNDLERFHEKLLP
jgi:class 3 adenylate cyclase